MPGKGKVGRRRIDPSGYVRICVDTDNTEVYEHRLIAARVLGRALLPEEEVHHKNEIRSDNRWENLEVHRSHAEHMAQHPLGQRARVMQLAGAVSKKRKTMTVTVPRVVAGIRELIDKGIKPTQRACRVVTGYNSIQKYVPQATLVAMAMEER